MVILIQLQYTVINVQDGGSIPMWLPYSSCVDLYSSHVAPVQDGRGIPVWLPYSSSVEGTSHQSEILHFLIFDLCHYKHTKES